MAEIKSFKHKTIVEVRYVDIDSFGHVNNANFLTYFEQARIKYFNDVASWEYDWSKKGVIVARAEINYIVPIRFGDDIYVHTNCPRLGNKSFDLQYRIFRVKEAKEELLADGMTVMVAYDYIANKAIEIPAEWKKAIEQFENSDSHK